MATETLDFLRHVGSAILDCLFPSACAGCGAFAPGEGGEFLCAPCRGGLRAIGDPNCLRCGAPRGPHSAPARDGCRRCRRRRLATEAVAAAFAYEGGARTLVHALKYRGARLLAAPLGEEVASAVARAPWASQVQVVVPVPLHRARERERGYNQAELLAAPVAAALGAPLEPGALSRRKETLPLFDLGVEARREALDGAFAVPPRAAPRLRGRGVLLVDDVLTTGATVSAAADALRAAGARAVYAAVLARD